MPAAMMTRTDCLREYGSDYFVRQKMAAGELYRLGRNIYAEKKYVPELALFGSVDCCNRRSSFFYSRKCIFRMQGTFDFHSSSKQFRFQH